MGRIHLRMYEPMEATRDFSNFLFDYPSHPMAPRALESLGDALKYLGQPLAAAENYAAAASMKDSAHLRWQHFWNLVRGKDLSGALTLLETPGYVAPRAGDDATTVAYWHAKILERLGKKAEADAKYVDILNTQAESFYAHMISMTHPELIQSLTSPGAKGDTRRFSLAARLIAHDEMTAKDFAPLNPELKVVDELLKVGLRETADIQLAGLKNATYAQEDSFAAVSRISLALNDYQSARRIRYSAFSALKTMPTNWLDYMKHQADNSDEWKLYYPLAFEKIVAPVAAKIRINPFIILSVMRAESFYNREARSGVGAQGLMQLMPYTAVKIASLLQDDDFDVRDLADPETNIGYGSYYLDKLLRYYEGNPFVAVAAYNGGPMVVNQWLDSCKDCAADEFVDSIPYRETRRYVREVMRNYAQYAHIYAGKAPFKELPALPSELPDGEEIF
jgi:soluble lytic murein transglycosylase-like protein